MGPNTLANIIAELDCGFKGALVSKIHQPGPKLLVLTLFHHGRDNPLLISTEVELARLHLTEARLDNPPRPPRFCALLRNRIKNALITGFSLTPGERIAEIKLQKKVDGKISDYHLTVELTGKSANIILVDSEGVIVDALRHFAPPTSKRVVLPGEEFVALSETGIKKIDNAKDELTEKTHETWNETADAFYSEIYRNKRSTLGANELRRVVKRAEKRAKRKLRNLLGDNERAEEGVANEKLGELLKANFQKIEKGMGEIEVDDWYESPPKLIAIALEKKCSPKENVERYFKRAKKGKRALRLLASRIPKVKEDLTYIEGLIFSVDKATDESALKALRDELIVAGFIKEKATEEKSNKKKDPKKKEEPIERSETSDGFTMLVGKSGPGNDLIVKKYAKAGDLWFHAKASAGAHALLKAKGKEEFSDEAIREAAKAAASRSKSKEAGKVEVIYTDPRNITKPKGAKPGMVRVGEYKSVLVETG